MGALRALTDLELGLSLGRRAKPGPAVGGKCNSAGCKRVSPL